MSEEIPWTWTELGEDSMDHRHARRHLHETREQQLYMQAIDPRLIGFVWNGPPTLTDALVRHDLTDVSWVDDHAVEHPGLVPILSLGFMELGIGARGGRLFTLEELHEEEVDLPWVWERIFEPGLRALKAALDAQRCEPARLFEQGALLRDALFEEFGQLGGPALETFAAGILGFEHTPIPRKPMVFESDEKRDERLTAALREPRSE